MDKVIKDTVLFLLKGNKTVELEMSIQMLELDTEPETEPKTPEKVTKENKKAVTKVLKDIFKPVWKAYPIDWNKEGAILIAFIPRKEEAKRDAGAVVAMERQG